MRLFVFIYAKDNEIKALNIEQSKRLGDSLIKEGWVHTQSLEPSIYIQFLHNNCSDIEIANEVKSLSKIS